jgi:preprotein translocase subunit SecF
MVTLPNIYKSKYARYYIAVPLVLLVFGLYFSTHIVLDSSLAGGVSITLQTSTAVNQQLLASEVSSKLHTTSPSIQSSPGGLTITIAINQSISNAEADLINLYAFNTNYTTSQLNITTTSIALNASRGNQTLIKQLAAEQQLENSSLAGMRTSLTDELSMLQPFIGSKTPQSDATPSEILAMAQGEYANASAVYENQTISAVRDIVPFTTYSYQQLTPTLGSFFLGQLEYVIIIAFIIISIVVFFIFRSVAPAFAVVFGAANDMIVAIGAMGLFGIPLGVASIGGLLMLIGYAIDTDLLNAVRILKRHEGAPEDRAFASMKTGLTMTVAAIVSFGVLFAVSLYAYVPTYYEISGVVLFGLIGDIFTTWLGNASIVLFYKKRKDKV